MIWEAPIYSGSYELSIPSIVYFVGIVGISVNSLGSRKRSRLIDAYRNVWQVIHSLGMGPSLKSPPIWTGWHYGVLSANHAMRKNVVAQCGLSCVLEKGEKKGRGGEPKGPWFDIRI